MLKQERILVSGKELIKTFSDNSKYIIQLETGIKYAEAVDIPNKYTYIESGEPIEKEEEVINEQINDEGNS